VSAADEKDPLLFHHDYDGIQEQDNPAPPWLTRTFVGCIVFAAAYFTWFHIVNKGETPQQKFDVAWSEYQAMRKEAARTEVVAVDENTLAAAAKDPEVLAAGKQVFAEKCVGCHTDNGRGLVGPNLTDDYQIHGHTRVDLYTTINQGVLDKGMPAWGEQLSQHDVFAAAAFVSTLRGTNVPGGKAPQGDKVVAFSP
jgi:cytochrome c oxidase cbb3-type subunit 3